VTDCSLQNYKKVLNVTSGYRTIDRGANDYWTTYYRDMTVEVMFIGPFILFTCTFT